MITAVLTDCAPRPLSPRPFSSAHILFDRNLSLSQETVGRDSFCRIGLSFASLWPSMLNVGHINLRRKENAFSDEFSPCIQAQPEASVGIRLGACGVAGAVSFGSTLL